MASSTNIFKSTTTTAPASTAMNKNATNNLVQGNNSNNINNNNNKPSNCVGAINDNTSLASSTTSPLKLIHSNDIKLLSDTALLSSIDLFGSSSKCEHNTNSGDGVDSSSSSSSSGDGVGGNEKSVLANSKSLASLTATENLPADSSPPLTNQNQHHHHHHPRQGIVKSTSIGKIKSNTDVLKPSGELKRMAGTTQAIEANLGVMSSTNQQAIAMDKDFNVANNSSSIIRDISMSNIDDTPGLIMVGAATTSPLNLSPISLGVTSSDALKCSCKSLFSIDNEENKYDLEMCKSAMDMSNVKNEISVDSNINKLNASSKDSKKKVKRSALAWVGRTVGK